jgi:site-specific DNA-methyltransferase (adenine-specific)
VNLGDTYNGSKKGNTDTGKNRKAVNSSFYKQAVPGIRDKSLVMVPARFAIAMCEHGWILRNKIIWHKPNVMPQSCSDRFTVDYEEFFFFTKSPSYYFIQQKEPALNAAAERNKRTVWSIPTVGSPEEHCAMFPASLIETPIKACTPAGGVVLDPFCGSGTVLEYCFEHDIEAIGIEINPAYKDIIRKRAHIGQSRLGDYEEADV